MSGRWPVGASRLQSKARRKAPGQAPAVVVKLDYVTGLQAARILAGYGIPVIGIADDKQHFCCRTNACDSVIEANTSNQELIDALIDLGHSLGERAVLFPCSDDSVSVISLNREVLAEWYDFVLPEHEVMDLFMDKEQFYRHAQGNDLPIPKTFFPRSGSDLPGIAEQVGFPCIIKPPRGTREWYAKIDEKVVMVNDYNELVAGYARCADATDQPIVQQWIGGTDANLNSCTFYYDRNGDPVITFTSRKLRQWPIERGEICLGEEVRIPQLVEHAEELLKGIGFSGFGSLEMKKSPVDGNYYMIEANVCRLPLRFKIVEAGGVELLYSHYLEASGHSGTACTTQTHRGVKWVSLHRDLLASSAYMAQGDLTLTEWLQSLRGVNSFAVLSVRDPLPFLLDFPFRTILVSVGRRGLAAASDALTGLRGGRRGGQD